MDKSETPRTDAQLSGIDSFGHIPTMEDRFQRMCRHARTLEREVTALAAANADLTAQLAEARRDAINVTKDDMRRVAEAAVYETEYDGQMHTICGCCGNNLFMNGDKHEPDCVRQHVLNAAMKEPK